MFESNFPPDTGISTCCYPVTWNAFKRIVGSYSEAEKNSLFSEAARNFYAFTVT
jgi:L-fuconolactonase